MFNRLFRKTSCYNGEYREFLHTALAETRVIKAEIKSLENDIALMKEPEEEHEFQLPGQDLSFNLIGYNKEDSSIWEKEDYLDKAILDHTLYQERIVKDLPALRKYIPTSLINIYFDLIHKFDKQIQRFDPCYPVL